MTIDRTSIPICYNVREVDTQNILLGRKTQIRTLAKVILTSSGIRGVEGLVRLKEPGSRVESICHPSQFKKAGNLVWFREHLRPYICGQEHGIQYAADGKTFLAEPSENYEDAWWLIRRLYETRMAPFGRTWLCCTYTPAWTRRITAIITDLRAERLQSISDEDLAKSALDPPGDDDLRTSFIRHWNARQTNKQWQWEANPWVWVTSFELHGEQAPPFPSREVTRPFAPRTPTTEEASRRTIQYLTNRHVRRKGTRTKHKRVLKANCYQWAAKGPANLFLTYDDGSTEDFLWAEGYRSVTRNIDVLPTRRRTMRMPDRVFNAMDELYRKTGVSPAQIGTRALQLGTEIYSRLKKLETTITVSEKNRNPFSLDILKDGSVRESITNTEGIK